MAPDENTIRLFRERLTRSGAIDKLFTEFDRQVRASGYLAMGGQIVAARLVAASRQRNTAAEKAQIKAGRMVREIWKDEPNKAAQKDIDAGRSRSDGRAIPRPPRLVSELAIALFGDKTHVAIDRPMASSAVGRRPVRRGTMGSAARDRDHRQHFGERPGGHRLPLNGQRGMVQGSQPGEQHSSQKAATSADARHIRCGNATKSKVRSAVEHVFA